MTKTPEGWEGILDKGEKILWQGRPDGGFHLHFAHIFFALFGAAFAGFALFWMVLAYDENDYFWTFGLIHFTIGLIVMLAGPLGGPYLRRHTWYTLTNRRGFVATDLPLAGRKLKSYPIRPDTPVIFEEGELATVLFATERQFTKNGVSTRSVGFHRIRDGRHVLSLIRQIQNPRAKPGAEPQESP